MTTHRRPSVRQPRRAATGASGVV